VVFKIHLVCVLLEFSQIFQAIPIMNHYHGSWLANSCVLLFVDAVYYSYGVKGKTYAEKYEEKATKQGY